MHNDRLPNEAERFRVSDTERVAEPLLRRLWYALAGAALFMAVALLQGATRAGYDSWHQAISALSLGPRGWVQGINFIVFGALLLSTVPVWRRILVGGKGATSYPVLTAIVGLTFVVVAFVPQDPAPGYDPDSLRLEEPTVRGLFHLGLAGIAAVCSVAALFVMASRFKGDPNWRGWPLYTRSIAIIMIACIVVYGVWSTRATGLAGTFERVAVMLPSLWALTFLRRLSLGTPFIIAGEP